jgi:tetratricopeptide (TPR) repeat protein
MRSCIFLSYIGMSAALCLGQEPDRLYADRANLGSARRAAELWAAVLAGHPAAFEAAWKLARADYWLGEHVNESERRAFLEAGIEAGRKAAALQPNRPEGHFWIAVNMGALAESSGIRAGLKYRKPVKEELETVLRLDPAFMEGSADRALGRWYFHVPGLLGGSNTKAEAHLRASLTYDEQSTVSHFFLAEVLVDAGRKDEARTELQKVLNAPVDPEWVPEDTEYKARAGVLLRKLGTRKN